MNLRLFFLTALLVLVGIKPVNAEQLSFLSHSISHATHKDENNELRGRQGSGLRGFLVELVRELMITMNHHPKVFREIPFVRALKMVQNEPDYVLFNISRTKEREKTVKWVGPTYSSANFFYKRRGDEKVNIKSAEDAKLIGKIGVQNGAGNDTELTALGFENLQRVKTQGHALSMLVKGRVDLVVIGENVIELLATQRGIDYQLIEKTPVKFSDNIGYLAFSKNVDDEIIRSWQAALDQLKSSKRYEELIRQYLIVKD